MFPSPPIISGLLRPAKIGLASKGMTHGMTKLLCLSVRLGLYPTDICWLRLIQALEKPGIRVRHRWLFPVQFCLARDSEGEWKNCFQIFILFLQTLKYNCLYKSTRKRRIFTYCNSVCVFFLFFLMLYVLLLCFILFCCADPTYWWLRLDRAVTSAETFLVLWVSQKNNARMPCAI